MAKHPNCNRLLRATRVDIKNENCEQATIKMNENSSKINVRLVDYWLAGWLDDWLVWAAAVVGVITY